MSSVVQEWMSNDNISWKQQTVVLSALRGCDSSSDLLINKIKRQLRMTILKNAAGTGTSFMHETSMSLYDIEAFAQDCDRVPNHYYMHVLHAFEIIAYKHPNKDVSEWFMSAYLIMLNAMHVNPETESQCDIRLADACDNKTK